MKTTTDPFLQAYIATALWSSNDESTPSGGKPLDSNYSEADLAPETLKDMSADCERFRKLADPIISEAIETPHGVRSGPDFDEYGRAAHDFWLTRNGHGAGFWDGDWPEPMAEQLSEISRNFGECNLYVGDDGKIYIS